VRASGRLVCGDDARADDTMTKNDLFEALARDPPRVIPGGHRGQVGGRRERREQPTHTMASAATTARASTNASGHLLLSELRIRYDSVARCYSCVRLTGSGGGSGGGDGGGAGSSGVGRMCGGGVGWARDLAVAAAPPPLLRLSPVCLPSLPALATTTHSITSRTRPQATRLRLAVRH
jgi:hypothetical protein